MAAYSFLTTWCVAAPLERVWDVLSDPEGYPEWWKGVREVTVLEPGEGGGRGVVMRQGADGLAQKLGAQLLARN